MGINADSASNAFLALGVTVVGLNLVIAVVLTLIYAPKLRKEIENLLNVMSQNWVELQILTVFAYVQISLTNDTFNILTANDNWVFFNFLDTFYGNVTQLSQTDYGTNTWSESAFKNVFTITLFSIGYVLVYAVFKVFFKKSLALSFFEFEIGLHLMKIFFFRVAMSLFLEIYLIYEGNSASYNTGVIIFFAAVFLVAYPLGKILYLRLKFRGNLDSSLVLRVFGRDFRDYQPCWREFHLITEQFSQVLIAACIVLMQNYKVVQIFALLGVCIAFLAYSIIFKPFRYKFLNLESWFSHLVITAIIGIIVGSNYYSNSDFLNYGVMIGLAFWYSGKLFFTFVHIYNAFNTVKKLLDQEEVPENVMPSLLNEEKSKPKKKKILKPKKIEKNEVSDDNTVITSKNEKDEFSELERGATENSTAKQRIKRNVTIESSPDSIDPRLNRKRTSRKRKTTT